MWTSVTLGCMHARAWECDAAHMPDDNELLVHTCSVQHIMDMPVLKPMPASLTLCHHAHAQAHTHP